MHGLNAKIDTMAQKLYKATVETTFYFVAEKGREQSEAERCMNEAMQDDCELHPYVREVKEYEHLYDWEDHELLVYGELQRQKDLTLKDAFELGTGKNYEKEKQRAQEVYLASMEKYNMKK